MQSCLTFMAELLYRKVFDKASGRQLFEAFFYRQVGAYVYR